MIKPAGTRSEDDIKVPLNWVRKRYGVLQDAQELERGTSSGSAAIDAKDAGRCSVRLDSNLDVVERSVAQ